MGGTCEIFDIQLAFKNIKNIEKLNRRGNFVASGDQKSVDQIDKKINEFLQKKGEKDKLCEITHAYIVFKHERGHDIALEFTNKKENNDLILGKKPKFIQAKHPNNVIWEN